MNHQVLSGDLMNDGPASRFRHDGPDMGGAPAMTMTDYRHVPLMDQDEPMMGSEMT